MIMMLIYMVGVVSFLGEKAIKQPMYPTNSMLLMLYLNLLAVFCMTNNINQLKNYLSEKYYPNKTNLDLRSYYLLQSFTCFAGGLLLLLKYYISYGD